MDKEFDKETIALAITELNAYGYLLEELYSTEASEKVEDIVSRLAALQQRL